MATNVSTLEQQNQTLQYLAQLRSQASTLEAQISTGEKSTTFSGIAPQAAQLIDLQATTSLQQGYISNINTATTQLQTMSLAMQNIAGIATTFADTLSNSAFDPTGASIQQTAQQLLTELGSYLNTDGGSGYVFSGNLTNTIPFNASGLPNPGDLTTNVAADYYQGDNGVAQVTIDTNNTVQYGITANNPAFEQIVRVLNYYANDSTPLSQTNPTDVANVQQAQQMLQNAGQQVQQLISNAGEEQADMQQVSTAHQNAIALAQTQMNNIQQVDSATAITQLNTLQTQLEASYQTTNILQQLSLVNYMK